MKTRTMFASALAGLAIYQGVSDWPKFGSLISQTILDLEFYEEFSAEVQSWLLCLGLLLLLFTLFPVRTRPAAGDHPATAPASAHSWLLTFLLVLGCSAALVMYTNPEGRFPWRPREAYLSVQARTVKASLYKALPQNPAFISMGSSISFTIPADYVGQKWDVDAFNLSVSGGSPDDFFYLLNFVINQKQDAHIPAVVTIELARPNLRSSGWNRMPISLIPYMEPDQALRSSFELVDHTMSSTYIADSLFTLAFVDRGRWLSSIVFDSRGTGLRTEPPLTYDEYRANVKREISTRRVILACKRLDPSGSEYIRKIVELSEQYKFAVVFYAPPVNADFYKLGKLGPASFRSCRKKTNAYMHGFSSSYDNIFYRDLSDYEPITQLGPEAYLDTHHLTTRGNQLLLDALAPEIEAALQWVRDNRSQE